MTEHDDLLAEMDKMIEAVNSTKIPKTEQKPAIEGLKDVVLDIFDVIVDHRTDAAEELEKLEKENLVVLKKSEIMERNLEAATKKKERQQLLLEESTF